MAGGWVACAGRGALPARPPAPVAPREGDSIPAPVVVVREPATPASRTPWSDSLLRAMPTRDKVAQLVVVVIDGDSAAAEALGTVFRGPPPGALFVRGGTRMVRPIVEGAGAALPIPLLVGANLEGGPTALADSGLMPLPGLPGLAATRDTMLACTAGATIARQALQLGINWSVSLDSVVVPPPDTIVRAFVRSVPERAVDRYVRCQEDAGVVVSSRWADTTGRSDRPRASNLVFVGASAVARTIDSLAAAVDSGLVASSALDARVAAVLHAKERLALHRAPVVHATTVNAAAPDSTAADGGTANGGTTSGSAARDTTAGVASDSLADVIARQSIVLARDRGNAIWRMTRARRVAAIVYDPRPRGARDSLRGAAFLAELRADLRARNARLDAIAVGSRPRGVSATAAIARARDAEAVVLAVYPPDGGGIERLPAAGRDLARRLLREKPNAIVVALTDAGIARELPQGVGTLVVGWNGRSPYSERAAARAVASPPPRDSLLAARLADTVRAVMERYQADSAFPGAQAVVGSHDRVLASVGVGRVDWAPSAEPTDSTIWDLASLTKVVGMTTGIMQLVAEGRVNLDAPAQRYIPRFKGPGKRRVTIRHLITHSSGLPAWRPLYKEGIGPDEALKLVYLTPLDTVPGARMAYSDLGAILLGQVIEKVTKERLSSYLRRRAWQPLKMTDTRYRPDSALLARIAPTEYDPWRQRMIQGVVHDQNAYALGGISGHAGLFSSARDLARFARMYLNFGTLDGRRVLEPRVIYDFVRVQDSSFSNRALGWEKPTGSNSAGRRMSPAAFGHTGFTGTSIWIDPANDLFVVLLTNRVNPTRQNNRFGEVRIAVADAALAVLGTVRQGTPPLVPRF